MELANKRSVLAVIVIAQFFCTSLWFAVNGIAIDLINNFNLGQNAIGHLTSAIQLGFITGTLLFAFLAITDRFSPSIVFLMCALAGALVNSTLLFSHNTYVSIIIARFLVGLFLAGIYPVGMKIAADYFDEGLGRSLGFLVGALVLGTALPHLIKGLGQSFTWKIVVLSTSILATTGGILVAVLIADGPFRRRGSHFDLSIVRSLSQMKQFSLASIGYFGHMWELYAFWAFVPVLLNMNLEGKVSSATISLLSFAVIALGGIGCIGAGYLSDQWTKRKVAFFALFISTICCTIFPLLAPSGHAVFFILLMAIWGLTVVADSPMFSTLVANSAPPEIRGSAITLVTCIGFLISILSIQILSYLLSNYHTPEVVLILTIGPIGALAYNRLIKK